MRSGRTVRWCNLCIDTRPTTRHSLSRINWKRGTPARVIPMRRHSLRSPQLRGRGRGARGKTGEQERVTSDLGGHRRADRRGSTSIVSGGELRGSSLAAAPRRDHVAGNVLASREIRPFDAARRFTRLRAYYTTYTSCLIPPRRSAPQPQCSTSQQLVRSSGQWSCALCDLDKSGFTLLSRINSLSN